MVRTIIKDEKMLRQKSDKFMFANVSDMSYNVGDEYLIQDILETAEYHKDNCVGLAAIQMGIPKRLIAVKMGDKFVPMINPVIIQKSKNTYIAIEGCLSLEGQREVRRHQSIKVAYTTRNNKPKVETFKGFIAEIIQHEVDHTNGILI